MPELGSLEQLVGFALESLDIPRELSAKAEAVYNDLGAWVMKHDAAAGRKEPSFFPQGSAALGTTTIGNGDWDIDAVYERPIDRTSTSQELLKAQAKEVLDGFRDDQRRQQKPVPEIVERPRCWRLVYDGFHIDALPAIPEDVNDDLSTRLLISDHDLRDWIPTDPKGYIAWFIDRMGKIFETERRMLAEATERAIEQVPVWEVKTVLQRTVQYVRMHRDQFYGEDADDLRPPSILVTTLVALCYEGEKSIDAALAAVAERIEGHIRSKDGAIWVPNPTESHLPVDDQENLARALVGGSRNKEKFERWIQQLCANLSGVVDSKGQALRKLLAEAVGENSAKAADERIAKLRTEQREAGGLRMAAGTGILGAAGDVVVPGHTFDGDSPK